MSNVIEFFYANICNYVFTFFFRKIVYTWEVNWRNWKRLGRMNTLKLQWGLEIQEVNNWQIKSIRCYSNLKYFLPLTFLSVTDGSFVDKIRLWRRILNYQLQRNAIFLWPNRVMHCLVYDTTGWYTLTKPVPFWHDPCLSFHTQTYKYWDAHDD